MSQRRRQVCNSPDSHRTTQFIRERLLQMLLDAVHFHRGQKCAVGQLRKPLHLATHADEAFHMLVPRLDVAITNRPIDCPALPRIGFKVHRTPTV